MQSSLIPACKYVTGHGRAVVGAGVDFIDHVFALMHLLGFRFAPHIRDLGDLGDTKLSIPGAIADYSPLKAMSGLHIQC
jgi:hypothetical protein